MKAWGHSTYVQWQAQGMYGWHIPVCRRGDEKSFRNTFQIASDKVSIIVDMSSLTNMSGNDNLWYQVTCMAYLSEEVAATYVMQHSITRAVLTKTDINEVYSCTMLLVQVSIDFIFRAYTDSWLHVGLLKDQTSNRLETDISEEVVATYVMQHSVSYKLY